MPQGATTLPRVVYMPAHQSTDQYKAHSRLTCTAIMSASHTYLFSLVALQVKQLKSTTQWKQSHADMITMELAARDLMCIMDCIENERMCVHLQPKPIAMHTSRQAAGTPYRHMW